jgi:FkbM family methyltransferase
MLIPYSTLIKKYNICPTGVLHIGANTGQEVNDYYNNGVNKTLWIEADPSLMTSLDKNIKSFKNAMAINACLTDKDNETVEFNISNNEGQSSSILELQTHKTAHPEVHYVKKIKLNSIRLDSLFKKNNLNINEYEFVNIDIQGAELLCLKGFGDLLNSVKYIYLEVNDDYLYSNCALYPEIVEYLKTYGFEPKEKKMAGNFGWGDAFFIKM